VLVTSTAPMWSSLNSNLYKNLSTCVIGQEQKYNRNAHITSTFIANVIGESKKVTEMQKTKHFSENVFRIRRVKIQGGSKYRLINRC